MGSQTLLTIKTTANIAGKDMTVYKSCTLYAPQSVRRLLPFLNKHYSESGDAEFLINNGNISRLRERVEPDHGEEHSFNDPIEDVTIFYGRDRGENNQGPMTHQSWDMAIDSSSYQDCLIYSGGKWDVVEHVEAEEGLKQYVAEALTEWSSGDLREQVLHMGTEEFFESYRERYEENKNEGA